MSCSATKPRDGARAARACHLTSGLAAAWEGDISARYRCYGDRRQVAARLAIRGRGRGPVARRTWRRSASITNRPKLSRLESAADLYQAGDLWAVEPGTARACRSRVRRRRRLKARDLYQDSLQLARTQSDARGEAQALCSGWGSWSWSWGSRTRLRTCSDRAFRWPWSSAIPELLGQAYAASLGFFSAAAMR